MSNEISVTLIHKDWRESTRDEEGRRRRIGNTPRSPDEVYGALSAILEISTYAHIGITLRTAYIHGLAVQREGIGEPQLAA